MLRIRKTAAALSGGIKIDGVIAFYPSCRVSFEDKSFNNAKILIFLGLKDMVAPAVLCKELKESHGLPHAEIREYPDAGHSWLFKKKKKKSIQRTWGECRINIDPAGVWHGEGFVEHHRKTHSACRLLSVHLVFVQTC